MITDASTTLTMESWMVRGKDQVSADLKGEAVILNLKTGKYYSLNPVGTRIWELIENPQTIQSLVDAIEDEYQVERERLEKDVFAVFTKLLNASLVECRDSASPRGE
jgi:hypothetical protein